MSISFGNRLQHAWNAFTNRDPTYRYTDVGGSSGIRPDRLRLGYGNERSIITAVYNRIAIDVAAISIQHVRLDPNGRFKETVYSDLNNCLTLNANMDQTGRALIQDVVMSMFDEGCIAIVPVDTDFDPNETESYKIFSLRAGKIIEWYPTHVKVRLYNEKNWKK